MEPSMASGEIMIRHRQHGFTYIGMLITVAITGAALAAAGEVWHTMQQRQRESELLFAGDQIRRGIGSFYNAGAVREYPKALDDLLRDPRHPGVVRHLRKQYYDPITGNKEWGVIRDANHRIVGVFSLSDESPIKKTNFGTADRRFEGKEKYSEWHFTYQPRRQRPTESETQK
jgi:type II secretory pathway pseudopilin PulG